MLSIVRSWKFIAVGALTVSAVLFSLIAGNILAGDPLAILDAAVASRLHAHSNPALTLLMLAVTHAHGTIAITGYSTALALYFAKRREWHWVAATGLAVPVGLLINVLLKHLFRRARPVFEDPLLTLSTYSFPSGHTAGTTLLYGVVAAYVFSRTRNARVRLGCVAGWVFMVVVVAFSRLYLGVHYLTDVVAAVTWSLAWLALCVMAARRLQTRFSLPRDS